eukprot:TRINITY_DN225_c0_g1_i1.p1 TRINITY_DN225_c0_g1~~TRINITY_DN225_c0_g1_i1.p1  ORF type:complete len:370 (+),score=41.98 TRINITY_DN225_c0_g1_i1:92-1201(+)
MPRPNKAASRKGKPRKTKAKTETKKGFRDTALEEAMDSKLQQLDHMEAVDGMIEQEMADEDEADEVRKATRAEVQQRDPLGHVNIKGAMSEKTATNKQRCLVFATRGITTPEKTLLSDLRDLLPHAKNDSPLDDKKKKVDVVPQLCKLKHCHTCVLLENRKRKDTYLYLMRLRKPLTVKFYVKHIHTMNQLKMVGNAIKGSRPFLHFDQAFESQQHLRVLKPLIVDIFGTPRRHHFSRPFIDHIFCFFWLDERIWFRNYQIVEKDAGKKTEVNLLEIGPRFMMQPIYMWDKPFGGKPLWKNHLFKSPNRLRTESREGGLKYRAKVAKKAGQIKRKTELRNVEEEHMGDKYQEVFEDNYDGTHWEDEQAE